MKNVFIIIVNGVHAKANQKKLNVSFGRLQKANIPFTVIETEYAGHATKIARQSFKEGYRRFISAGGDGTTHEILNGLFPMALGEPLSLGFLPLGTGNSFIKDFTDQEERYTIEAIIRGRKQKVDIALLENVEGSTYFLNILSLGFVAQVGKLRNRFFSRMGALGYKLAVMIKAIGQKNYPVAFSTSGQATEKWDSNTMFVSFNNSKYTGGTMMMAPVANLSDGKIDIIAAYPMLTEELLATFPHIFKGTHISSKHVRCAQSDHVLFSNAEKQPMMIDGEMIEASPKSLTVLPKALEVLL